MSHALAEKIQRFKKEYGKEAMQDIAGLLEIKPNCFAPMVWKWKHGKNHATARTQERVEHAIETLSRERGLLQKSETRLLAEQNTEQKFLDQIFGAKKEEIFPTTTLTNLERAIVIQGIMNQTQIDMAQKEHILFALLKELTFVSSPEK